MHAIAAELPQESPLDMYLFGNAGDLKKLSQEHGVRFSTYLHVTQDMRPPMKPLHCLVVLFAHALTTLDDAMTQIDCWLSAGALVFVTGESGNEVYAQLYERMLDRLLTSFYFSRFEVRQVPHSREYVMQFKART